MPKSLIQFFLLTTFFWVTLMPAQAKTNNILVLHSYHQGLEWTDNITSGIQSVLNGENSEIFYEYLDTKRNSGEQYAKNLIELFKSKRKNIHFDLIIVSDNYALDFVNKYSESLYPNTPIIFCGINHFQNNLIANIKEVTGITESIDIQGTIELMLNTHIDTKEIIVVHDQTTTGKAVAQNFAEASLQFNERVKFTYYNDFTFEQTKQDLAQINKNTLIYLLTFNRDKENSFISYRDGIKLISSVAKVPIYGSWQFYMGKGIIGGIVTSGFYQGQQAANLALKILSGENARDIPIIQENLNEIIFDFNIMTQFAISKKQLPTDSLFINNPPFFIDKLKLIPQWLSLLIVITILTLFMKVYTQRSNQLRTARMNKELDLLIKKKTSALNETSEKLNTLLDTLPCPIFYKDTSSVYQICNNAFAKTILGLPKEKINQHSIAKIAMSMPEHLTKIYRSQDLELIKNPGIQLYETQVKCFDGITRDYMLHKATLHDSSGSVSGIVGAMLDITDRKKSEAYLKESEERFFSLQDASFEGIAIHNGGIVIDVNQRLSEMTGYAHNELIGMDGFSLFSIESREKVLRNMLSDNKSFFETIATKKNGIDYPIEIRSRKIKYHGEMARVVVIRDVTAQKKAQTEQQELIIKLERANILLQSMATTDALTELFNRGYISKRFTKEVNISRRYASDLSIIMMDIDNFKKINDNYGHQVGDSVLKRISQIIKDCVRESDRVGRYGGEEFLILLPNTNLDNGYLLANRIRESIENLRWENTQMHVTISAGVAQFQGESEMAFLKSADKLLYCAKSQGRNRVNKST